LYESLSDLARQNVSVCDGWFGVVCDESKHVIEVVLQGNRLYGDLPDSFFTIPTLESVDLSNNNVQLPGFQEISPGNRLTVLNISNVRLQSMEGIGELTGLLELRIDGQALEQSLPLELFQITSLQTLHLQQGRFFGKIPSEIGLLTSLVDLNIYGNLLSGQLPNALGSLTKLQALDLSENQFEGDLPDISSLTDLNTFRIHQSEGVKNIGGPLPPFDTFPLLREVNLEFNALTGVIPDRFLMGVADTTSDITISLGYNQIEGAIPESLLIFDKLNLDLEGNKITRYVVS
jgi:Leucine-rich repeat (LRR) protein